jgi:hypothetical protein
MFEALAGGGIIGSLLGGVFRLVPEVLKFMDRKNERSHELSMFNQQCALEAQKSQQKLNEIGAQNSADVNTGVIGAFKAAIDQQTEMVKSAGGWAAALSASVRPVMTYYLLLLYGAVKTVEIVTTGRIPWSADDMALLSGVINYWILDRTLKSRGL